MYLCLAYALVDLGVELIASAHLSDVHPARVACLLQTISQHTHLILYVPLVTDEHLWWLHFRFC